MGKKLPPSSGFTRETQNDLYSLYNAGAEVSDFIQKIKMAKNYHARQKRNQNKTEIKQLQILFLKTFFLQLYVLIAVS